MKLKELNYSQENIQYHKRLNPVAWKGWDMIPQVRKRLLDITQLFVDYLELPDFEIEDVRLTGSMCNFNWTKHSDFDLHVVTDYKSLNCDDLAETLYKAKKTIWNDRHDITINGHEVELYIEDISKPPRSSGIFSVIDNQWLRKPDLLNPKYDHNDVNKKVQSNIDLLQKTIYKADNIDDFKKVINKLYRMRESGLESGGEFSTENLAFKVLRNLGWLDKLHKAQNQFIDKNYSI
jgi:hypothetical protein